MYSVFAFLYASAHHACSVLGACAPACVCVCVCVCVWSLGVCVHVCVCVCVCAHSCFFCFSFRARHVQRLSKEMLTNSDLDVSVNTVLSTVRITTLGGASEKCRYSQSVVIPEVSLLQVCVTVGWDFALGMDILSLFANCGYIRSRY